MKTREYNLVNRQRQYMLLAHVHSRAASCCSLSSPVLKLIDVLFLGDRNESSIMTHNSIVDLDFFLRIKKLCIIRVRSFL